MVEVRADGEHIVGGFAAPGAVGIGNQCHVRAGGAGSDAEMAGEAGITTALDDDQSRLRRRVQQKLGKGAVRCIHQMNVRPKVGKAMGQILGVAAFGLKAGDEYLAGARKPRCHGAESGRCGQFVIGNNGRDFLFERAAFARLAALGEVA